MYNSNIKTNEGNENNKKTMVWRYLLIFIFFKNSGN